MKKREISIGAMFGTGIDNTPDENVGGAIQKKGQKGKTTKGGKDAREFRPAKENKRPVKKAKG